jgi:hypothetical protein
MGSVAQVKAGLRTSPKMIVSIIKFEKDLAVFLDNDAVTLKTVFFIPFLHAESQEIPASRGARDAQSRWA